MTLPGQTDLAKLDSLPADLRQHLASLWIESVEDYLGLLGAFEAGQSSPALLGKAPPEPARALALSLVGPELGQELSRGRRGGALGCEFKPEVYERYRSERRLGPRREAGPLGLDSRRLPKAVRLMDKLPSVRDQADRGTCVAFATAALREFLQTRREVLSEQFLYWACKEMDGHPGPGTTLHTGMSALSEYGCCLASTWPYVPQHIPGDESQGPPPPPALAEARRYRLRDCRPVEPALVAHYKGVLAGGDGVAPMPVVLGILVFNSWYMSRAAHRTGKVTLPLPDEEPIGGHALCAVGYVDDDSVPGGGYFIMRNSWGQHWAAHSPEAPGHALIPYAYIETCAVDAFTGPSRLPDRQPPMQDTEFDGYTRSLERPTRDQSAPFGNGELLKEGTPVLFNPLAPGEVMRDTPDNQKKFEELDRAWTVPTRQRVWFRSIDSLPADFKRRLDSARANQSRFLSAIEENLKQSVHTPFPRLHVSKWAAFVPYEWEAKISKVTVAADLTVELAARMQRHSGVRPNLPWPGEEDSASGERVHPPNRKAGPLGDWAGLLEEINTLKVFRIAGLAGTCHVVAAFLTPLKLSRNTDPDIAEVSQEMLSTVRAVYERWSVSEGGHKPGSAFLTVAIEGELPAHLHTPASGEEWEMLVAFKPDGSWTMPPQRQEIERLSLRDFLDRLKPETREQRVSIMRKTVDEELDSYAGNVSESRLKSLTGYRRSQIRDAFDLLQAGHPDLYRRKRLDQGELAIERPQPGQPAPFAAAASVRRALRRHVLGLISLALGAGLALGNAELNRQLGLPPWLSFVLGILIAYSGQIVQKAINQRVELGKD